LRPALRAPHAPAEAATAHETESSETEQAEQETGPYYAVLPDAPRPGEPVTIAWLPAETSPYDFNATLLSAGGKRLAETVFFKVPFEQEAGDDTQSPPLLAAILSVPSTAEPGALLIRIESGGNTAAEIPLNVPGRDFVFEEIPLDQDNTDIRTRPDPQKDREAEALWAILNRRGNETFASGAFIPPLTSTRRTSFFGDRRVFKYSDGKSDTSIHAGVDYGVPKGTEVRACAAGRVVLARFRIVTGNSVIIEHLPGVYSLYYHLDQITVNEGAMTEQGALLGLSGSTGLATGPHLHWEIRVSGENSDPDAFTARPVLDKDAILSKLRTYP
jgi:murein DD-endopeptidase MepM/ murein hydrolase activator NlpD